MEFSWCTTGYPRATLLPWGNLLKIGCPEGWKKNQPCSGSVQGRIWPWMPWITPGHPETSQGNSEQPSYKSNFPDVGEKSVHPMVFICASSLVMSKLNVTQHMTCWRLPLNTTLPLMTSQLISLWNSGGMNFMTEIGSLCRIFCVFWK